MICLNDFPVLFPIVILCALVVSCFMFCPCKDRR